MLTERQGKILASIVSEYTKTAVPVSSSHLVKKYFSKLSPATIRNEMLELEKKQYLLKPHISAGRIPSDKGYRFFVDHFLRYNELKKKEQERLQVEMLRLRAQNTRLSRTLAKLLSTSSHCLGLSGVVEKDEYYDFGLHTLLNDPEFEQLDEISKISASLDLIDENVDVILKKIEGDETKIFIGKENPIKEIQQCSMIVAPYRLENGEKGILAIIGPKRMAYEKNKSLIDFVKNLLGGKSNKNKLMMLFIAGSKLAIINF